MSDASDYAAAFAELKRAVQPDAEPALTYGDGVTPNAAMELDAILLNNRRAVTWANALAVNHGDLIVPTSRAGRAYRVTRAGVLASPEPSWPTADYAAVTSGTAELEEAGYFAGNIYDLRGAKYEALDLKVQKAASKTRVIANAQGQAVDYLFLNLQRQRDRYRAAGVG